MMKIEASEITWFNFVIKNLGEGKTVGWDYTQLPAFVFEQRKADFDKAKI